MSQPTYIDVHVLQTVPPSNLNRDDAGSPKQAMFGGVRRARVSSQAWKRATRLAFAETIPEERQGTRTKRISGMLAERLADRTGIDGEQAVRIATSLLEPLEIKPGRRESDTAYLLFFGRSQLEQIVDLVAPRVSELGELEDKLLQKELKELEGDVKQQLLDGHPIDVALFGRMVADLPDLNVDAATQVAHAISTHPVEVEFDYYTAVDDEKSRSKDEDLGAEMIGTVEFNSATLYRYATVGLHQLLENLGGAIDDAIDAVERFLDGFTRSMPSGHQNSFAHRTLPSLVVVAVRDDQPVNLVSAFEDPIRARGGLAGASARRLAEEYEAVERQWPSTPLLISGSYHVPENGEARSALERAFGPSMPFPDLLARVRESLERQPAQARSS